MRTWKLNLTEEQKKRRTEIGKARKGNYSLETRKKMSEARIGMVFSKEHKNNLKIARNKRKSASKETRLKMGLAHKGQIMPESAKQKIREWHIKNPNRVYKDTSIELAIQDELADRQILFIKQYKVDGVAIVDFYLPEYNIIIQCDGCYWHNCLEHYPTHHIDQRQKDITKAIRLSARGYKVYRFWEHDIKKSAKSCISNINF